MIYYLKGKIVSIVDNNIIIDVRDVAYQILVSHPGDYEIGQERLVYTYNVVREDENYLVGFSTLDEKSIFLSLIKVKGCVGHPGIYKSIGYFSKNSLFISVEFWKTPPEIAQVPARITILGSGVDL